VAKFVPDGAEVILGASLETFIPFAAGREIMRQRKYDLTLVGPISDILFDQLIGAGCVKKVRAAWVGNVITGSGYNFRRAVESGAIEMEDHSNLTIAMALKAGALGVPFMPAYTALGSDLFKTNRSLKKTTCPFTGKTLTAVSAINPDVAVIHVQRSDEFGNAHAWGNLGITKDACMASRHVILTTEQIVDPDVITADPNRVIVPGIRVDAVVHAPWGAHPSPVPGFYNRDHQAFIDYQNASRTKDGFDDWLACWVYAVRGSEDYENILGKKRLSKLSIKNNLNPEPVDYGY
jgi:glutaconate CoA-transferase subunit A